MNFIPGGESGQAAVAHVTAGVRGHVTPSIDVDWQYTGRVVTLAGATAVDVGPTTARVTGATNNNRDGNDIAEISQQNSCFFPGYAHICGEIV